MAELTVEEQTSLLHGFAWAGLCHYLFGRAAGDAAREALAAQIQARYHTRPTLRHITPDLERLEADLRRRLGCLAEGCQWPDCG